MSKLQGEELFPPLSRIRNQDFQNGAIDMPQFNIYRPRNRGQDRAPLTSEDPSDTCRQHHVGPTQSPTVQSQEGKSHSPPIVLTLVETPPHCKVRLLFPKKPLF